MNHLEALQRVVGLGQAFSMAPIRRFSGGTVAPPAQNLSAAQALRATQMQQSGQAMQAGGAVGKPRYFWATIAAKYSIVRDYQPVYIVIVDSMQRRPQSQWGQGEEIQVAWASGTPSSMSTGAWIPIKWLGPGWESTPVSEIDLKSRGLGSAYCSQESAPQTGTGDVDSVRGWRGFSPSPTPSAQSQFRSATTPRTAHAQGETRAAPRTIEQARALGQTNVEMPSWGMSWLTTPRIRGFGAGGASAFTMTAAQALNDHLETNGCAGCHDMTSQLRQLTFAFKAAYLTDTGIAPQIALNMSTALAMTAFGSGTDQALGHVLGAAKSYSNGPCTDDSGHCLGNLPTPIIPPAVGALEQQIAQAIKAAIQQAPYVPQSELVNGLLQGFAALVNQIGFELAKLKLPPPQTLPPPVQQIPVVKTSATIADSKPSEPWTTGEKIAAGVAAGVVLTGVALVVYNATKGS